MDASLQCLVIVANPCVHSAVSIDFKAFGLGAVALIHEGSSVIVVVLRSDYIN